MDTKEILDIKNSLDAIREKIDSFISPWPQENENDEALLEMRFHIMKALLFSCALKGGEE